MYAAGGVLICQGLADPAACSGNQDRADLWRHRGMSGGSHDDVRLDERSSRIDASPTQAIWLRWLQTNRRTIFPRSFFCSTGDTIRPPMTKRLPSGIGRVKIADRRDTGASSCHSEKNSFKHPHHHHPVHNRAVETEGACEVGISMQAIVILRHRCVPLRMRHVERPDFDGRQRTCSRPVFVRNRRGGNGHGREKDGFKPQDAAISAVADCPAHDKARRRRAIVRDRDAKCVISVRLDVRFIVKGLGRMHWMRRADRRFDRRMHRRQREPADRKCQRNRTRARAQPERRCKFRGLGRIGADAERADQGCVLALLCCKRHASTRFIAPERPPDRR